MYYINKYNQKRQRNLNFKRIKSFCSFIFVDTIGFTSDNMPEL